VKVCGMTDLSNVEKICKLMPDYLGYIFYPKSARYVGSRPDPEIFLMVPDEIKKTAVFVNENVERMIELTGKYGIKVIQLHGMESPEVCKTLKLIGKTVIKVIPGNQTGNEKLITNYSDVVDYFLFDTPVKSYGGSGRKFDWTKLEEIESDVKFFLSGGISVEDVAPLKSIQNTTFYAADINSRFETSPGIKNPTLVERFINDMRNEK
jgi:phosphoribosylanthranilate isomerase